MIMMQSRSSKQDIIEPFLEGSITLRKRFAPPFIPSHDIPRGGIHFVQSTFSYTLMLAVM